MIRIWPLASTFILLTGQCTSLPQPSRAEPRPDSVSAPIRWNSAALQGIRDAKLGAPVVARALAIVHTCTYDAWAAYDERAVGTQLGGALRRPASERTLPNKEQAISYAAEGRIGTVGQRGSETINGGRTVPWIWSAIEFNTTGTPTYSNVGMFPTYSVYVSGSLVATYAQSTVAAFVAKDQTYELTPSQIP